MSSPQNELQQQLQASREKYTYFLLTAAGACIGYATEKVAGHPAIVWSLSLVAVSLLAWAGSFCFGCWAIRHNESSLRFNHFELTVARDSRAYQMAANKAFHNEARRSTRASRWQFYLFVVGGICFVVWRLTDVLGISLSAVGTAKQATIERHAPHAGGAGVLPESDAVHIGEDSTGRAAACIDGYAYDIPGLGEVRLTARFVAGADGHSTQQLKCQR